MFDDMVSLFERTSFLVFFMGLACLILAIVEYLVETNNLAKTKASVIVIRVVEIAFLLLVFLFSLTVFDAYKPTLFQSLGYVSTPLSLGLTIWLAVHPPSSDSRYRSFLLIGLLTFILAPTIYLIAITNTGETEHGTGGKGPTKRFVVYDLVGFYTGTITTENMGPLFVTLDISRIACDRNGVIFEYAVTTAGQGELYGRQGRGRIFLDNMVIEFEDEASCRITFEGERKILESKEKRPPHWKFRESQ